MQLRKVTAASLIAASLAGALGACDTSVTGSGGTSGNALTNRQQAVDSQQLAFVQPLPFFPFSQIKQNLIEIEAIQALGISSTTFIFIPGINHPVLQCPSQGVPVPATDELSNPVTAQWSSGTGGNNAYAIAGVTVGQVDPTGIYSGDTTGTNGLCLTNTGAPYDAYNEAYFITVTASAYWDKTIGMIHVTGTPVMPTCKVIEQRIGKKLSAYERCTAPPSALAGKNGGVYQKPKVSMDIKPPSSPSGSPTVHVTPSSSPSASPTH